MNKKIQSLLITVSANFHLHMKIILVLSFCKIIINLIFFYMVIHLLITMIIFQGCNVRNCRPIRTLIRIYFKGVRSFAELIFYFIFLILWQILSRRLNLNVVLLNSFFSINITVQCRWHDYTWKNLCIDKFSNLSASVPLNFQTSYWYSAWFTITSTYTMRFAFMLLSINMR